MEDDQPSKHLPKERWTMILAFEDIALNKIILIRTFLQTLFQLGDGFGIEAWRLGGDFGGCWWDSVSRSLVGRMRRCCGRAYPL